MTRAAVLRTCLAVLQCSILSLLSAQDPAKFGPGDRFQLEYSRDGFGIRSHGVNEMLASGQTMFYPLPQSDVNEFLRLRRADAPTNPLTPGNYERQEVIGPHQVEGGKLWFGNQFYDGEGDRGVGAFGYFDSSTRTYTLFSPPEVARYEVSAILVEPDVVWIALDHFGEDISTFPGGLVRWNRTTHAIVRYPIEFVVTGMRIQGDAPRLETRGGYALLRGEQIRRFSNDGKPIVKFPPPPSHY